VTLLLHLPVINWGLPCAERTELSYHDINDVKQILSQTTEDDIINSWDRWSYQEEYSKREEIPSWVFNPIRSYHADEHNVLKSISNMKPAEWDFNPHYFIWGTLYFYLVAAALKAAQIVGLLTITSDIFYYFQHPEAFAAFYRVGRLVSLFCTLGTVAGAYWLGRMLGNRKTGMLAALLTTMAPLMVGYGHFMTTDPPLACFFTLAVASALWTYRSDGGRTGYIITGILIGLAGGAKYNGAMSCIALVTVHLLLLYHRKQLLQWRAHLPIIIAGLFAAVVFILVTPYLVLAWEEFSDQVFNKMFMALGPVHTKGYKFGFYLESLWAGAQPIVVLLGLVGLCLLWKRRQPAGLILGSQIICYFLFFTKLMLREDRMLMPLVPLTAALAATVFLVEGVPKAYQKRWRQFSLPLIVLLIISLLPGTMIVVSKMTGPDIRIETGRWLIRNLQPGARVGMFGPILQYHQPPLDLTNYDMVLLPGVDEDYQRMCDAKPDYIIINLEQSLEDENWDDNVQVLFRNNYHQIEQFGQWDGWCGIATGLYQLRPLYTYLAPRIIILAPLPVG